MSKLTDYAVMQKTVYDLYSGDRSQAEAMVAPNYDQAKAQAMQVTAHILDNYRSRANWNVDVSELALLDVGCGVGRVMECFTQHGVGSIDGADVSQAMLSHARQSPMLEGSRFFETDGTNVGGVEPEAYDIVYSCLCMHHICMRQTRLKIVEAMARALKPTGMVWLEYGFFPGVSDSMIPRNHAHWADNKVARSTNSQADVWLTPESLGEAFRDMSLFFSDVRLEDITAWANYDDYEPNAIYQYPRNQFFISATKTPLLVHRLYGNARLDQAPR